MPCFKGLAVSIHTPDGPISEFSIQKQTRASRITTYIPVPPAKVPSDSTTGLPEQSTFAISITLLTPGLNIPYSTPKPTPEDPYPQPRFVGGLPGLTSNGSKTAMTPPYIPRTTSPNETIAAYIYFDGRQKEEVATLLRRGEETWVNSRWVGIPESEGGGLAEREFLFREVGLERWLNGLDLEGGKHKAERIERRQRRLEKKRRKQAALQDSDDSDGDSKQKRSTKNDVLAYGGVGGSPVQDIPDDAGLFSTDSDSGDEPPEAEAAGQIKVALYRVLASGEVKRGEYSPQFDAHEDEDGMEQDQNNEDIDHTTSFAKPKTLDPKSISTQTVTGLDPPETPYAVFTFFYRGEKQLQKMGILPTPEVNNTAKATKSRPGPDYSKFGPLKTHGTIGYSGYRDTGDDKRKAKRKDKSADTMDSDDDDDEARLPKTIEESESKQDDGLHLSPEDARRQGEIADGVQKIKLKRAHSAEPENDPATIRKSPHLKTEESRAGTPQSANSTSVMAGTPPESTPVLPETSDTISSPFKRHRASVAGLNGSFGGSHKPSMSPGLSALTTSTDASQDAEAGVLPNLNGFTGINNEQPLPGLKPFPGPEAFSSINAPNSTSNGNDSAGVTQSGFTPGPSLLPPVSLKTEENEEL